MLQGLPFRSMINKTFKRSKASKKSLNLNCPMFQLLVSSAVLLRPSQETAAWSACSRSCSGGVQSRLQTNGTRCTACRATRAVNGTSRNTVPEEDPLTFKCSVNRFLIVKVRHLQQGKVLLRALFGLWTSL